mgnify:FL=1
MKNVQYIALTGVDGSGKSTQLKLLMDHLIKNGYKIAYFHAVEFSLANKISRLLKGKQTFEAGQEKAITESSFVSLILREKFLFIDFIRFQFWRRHLRLEGYDYILSDRSFYDSLINIEYLNLAKNSALVRFGLWFLLLCLPKAEPAFFFELSAQDIMTRSRVPEQGQEYLEQKLKLFHKRETEWHLLSINATKSEAEIFQKILDTVEKK